MKQLWAICGGQEKFIYPEAYGPINLLKIGRIRAEAEQVGLAACCSLTCFPQIDNAFRHPRLGNTMRFAKKSWLLAALVLIGSQQDSSGQDRSVGNRVPNSRSVQANSPSPQSTLTNSPAPELPKPGPSQDSFARSPNLPAKTGAQASPHPLPQVGRAAKTGALAQPGAQPNAPSAGCFFLNARSFTIPFTVDAAGSKPREVQLYASRGSSSPWQRVDGKPATTPLREFQFTGQEDGEFWFATRTIDSVGRAHPTGPIQPQLKVFVDTSKPEIVLEAEADASGRVDLKVTTRDASPLQMQLRYVTDTVRTWQQVPVAKLPADGMLHFTPGDSWEQLSLQFVATDSAKNQSIVSKLLSRPRLAESPHARLAATGEKQGGDVHSAQFRSDIHPTDSLPTASDPVIRLAQNPGSGAAIGGSVYGNDNRNVYSGNPASGYAGNPISALQGGLNGYRGGAPIAPARPIGHQAIPSDNQSGPADNSVYGRRIVPSATPNALPLPATREQISHGFGPPPTYPANRVIGIPPQTLTGEVIPTPAGQPADDGGFGLNGPQQSAPLPETRPASPATAPPSPPRPRTPSEAMRPLSPSRLTPDELGGRVETIPAPAPQVDPQTTKQTARRPVETDITSGRVPVRYSDSVRFSLEFEVEAIGSAGVESIELYGSTDGGQTWKYWGEDPDRISPFDIETKEEGVFGFRIVVVGRNGLTSPRPLPGETPDIAVVVDQIKPVVRISAAQYGEGDRIGSLVIGYECEDANLMQRPISLSFSDAVDGPWTTIAAGLRNEGHYVWPADPGLPRKLYLRIDAKDQAGNVGTYILDRPIDAQGLAPRARIRGFQPLSGSDSASPAPQTAARPQRPRS